LSEVLDADSQQRIVFRFALKDAKSASKEPMSAHQTFVRFANSLSGQEVVSVAEMDSELNFKLDLNLHSKAKDFRHLSGEYEISLLIGDPVIQNPIHWSVAKVRLHFAGQSEREAPKDAFGAKPEIRHVFRAHERRPAPVVSNAFSLLALLPLGVLFALVSAPIGQ
jgi:oligosaccharyltransferase complex subunit delta (ribophorin II)